jgi:hypothetical protein
MNPTSQAVIAIRGPEATGWFARWRRFAVRIDNRWAGKVKLGTGEFAVEPGVHVVTISMEGYRSRPLQVVVEPGTRTELTIRNEPPRSWWKKILPIVVLLQIAGDLTDAYVLQWMFVGDVSYGVRQGVLLVVYAALLAGFVLATSRFFPNYWVAWALEDVGKPSVRGAARG